MLIRPTTSAAPQQEFGLEFEQIAKHISAIFMLLCQFHLTAKVEKHRGKIRQVSPSICYDQS